MHFKIMVISLDNSGIRDVIGEHRYWLADTGTGQLVQVTLKSRAAQGQPS
jgi:hypothetical protein